VNEPGSVALWPFGLVTFTSKTRLRGAPTDGTLTVAVMPVPAELTITAEAVGAGPFPLRKVTVAPLTKFVPAIVKDVVDVPAFIEVGLMLLIVGGPADTEFTVEVVCAVLLAVLVSPATVLALATRVCVPVVEGVQPKVRVCEAPAPRLVTDCGVLVIADCASLRVTEKDSACVPRFRTVTVTVCAVFTTTGEGAETELTATS